MKPTDQVIFCGAVYYAVQRGFQFGSMSTIRPVKLSQRAPLVPGGGGGGDSHMKQTGMLVVSLRRVKRGFQFGSMSTIRPWLKWS